MKVESMSRPPPPRETKPEPQARAELLHYIGGADRRYRTLPKRIAPSLVATVLHEKLAEGRPDAESAPRMVAIADFYQTRSVAPDFLTYLDRTEQTERDVFVSAALTRGVGYVGDRGERDLARGNFHHLLSLPLTESLMPSMVEVYEALTPDETSGILLGRLDEVIDALRAREQGGDLGAATQRRTLEDVRNNAVRRVDLATQMKQEILGRPLETRLDGLVDIYIGADQRYVEHTKRWAVRSLVRQAREHGDEAAVGAFRRALVRLGPRDDDNDLERIRSILAIEFFGGDTTPEERDENTPSQRFFELTLLD